MSHFGTRILSLFLAITILLSCALCAAAAQTATADIPQESEATAPEEATEEALPEETLPAEPTEESLPEETVAETQPETLPEETFPEMESQPAALGASEEPPLGPGLYFGQLHAHTGLSGGYGTVAEAFQYAASLEGLDFFAVTDHSNAFDNALSGSIGTDGAAVSAHWAEGKAAAAGVTCHSFVGIWGFEMSWPRMAQLGHIGTFATPGFQSWEQEGFSSADSGLQNYYAALACVPGAIGQFCHPGTQYGTFTDFDHYSESADSVMKLIELFCGEGTEYETAYDAYIRALDKGWHLAPTAGQANFLGNWGSSNALRTVVYAQSLTEDGIYDALREYRVYATEDEDLEILYTLGGHLMGSRLKRRQIGDMAELSVSLQDPTDDAIGLLEVIADGGQIIASQTLQSGTETVNLSLPGEYRYYFLKITQPDGQTAVTAPVWVDHRESLGISGITCETAIPVQNQDTVLSLALFNREDVDFAVDNIQIFADGAALLTDTSRPRVPAGGTLNHRLTVSCGSIGQTRITVLVSGTLEGAPRSYEAALDLCFRRSDQVTDIVIDGSHGNAALQNLAIMQQLAAEENIQITVAPQGITAQMLESCRFLVVPAPTVPFSEEFLSAAAQFAAYGGSILVCGQASSLDWEISSAGELNRLLEALDSTMRLRSDQALDDVNNGGSHDLLLPAGLNTASDWCAGASGQRYRQKAGCTVDPGHGTWLVQADETTRSAGESARNSSLVLLAWEALSGGGSVFAAGSFPFADADLAEPKNIWDAPYANRTLLHNLMEIGGEVLPLTTIRQARTGENDRLVRIRGYVTAGTANPYNTFSDTLYLQDDTGGIAVTGFRQSGISPGTPIEITGVVQTGGRNPVIQYASHNVLDAFSHRYTGKTGSWDTLLDPERHGGELVQVEGRCTEVMLRRDGTLLRCTLTDSRGSTIQVLVEDGIGSHATGENTLHTSIRRGRTVRAIGILHVDNEGIPVIRVRNCEEVVYVPPRAADIPNTADPMGILFFALIRFPGLPKPGKTP